MPNYKDTVFLPKTDFSMRAGLPKKEPEILEVWKKIDIYNLLRKKRKNCTPFILHDGPPYANGNLHIGHALNKILKDIINRTQSMLGKDANYVPGWDCHGLPIEWKIEENYRKKKKNKDEIPLKEFRAECREFASKWMKIQSDEFERLGVCGDWGKPYSTMNFESEASIMAELGKFLMNGGLYRGVKPVMWSSVEKTALAEAEIEYHDHKSTTIYAKFPVKKSKFEHFKNCNFIIWTTTPWTMPGNRALAYGKNIDYSVIKIKSISPGSLAFVNEKIVIADDLIETFSKETQITNFEIISKLDNSQFNEVVLKHPLFNSGYDYDVPLLEGDFVTTDQGTGFVHIAPGHGSDDFDLGVKHSLPIIETVEDDGYLKKNLSVFGGLHVLRDNEKIADLMMEHNALIGRGSLIHSYPHSWRSKAPLIFRTTPQWFISMEKNNLRKLALKGIEDTNFYPNQGSNRLSSMIKTRPDWCISRQRAWGVPIAIFYNKETLEPLRDQKVLDKVVESFKKDGADAWFSNPSNYFLGNDYDEKDYIKVTDIADVWFDSGSTHSYVLEDRDDLVWPASMYLEGTDQHRGWFHSSLLESCGTRGKPPFESVLTHGFVLDDQGRKMSKSLGNITSPQEVLKDFGADILRLWVIGSDYYDDLRIGKEILVRHSDHYRRLRNTLRYLLGALNDFEKNEIVDFEKMPEIEKWVLNKVAQLHQKIKVDAENFRLNEIYKDIHNFCNIDLSAFYFDIRKDTLYCSSFDSIERKSCRTVMDILFNSLTTWLAPILCFTSEEAWQTRYKDPINSVHLQNYFHADKKWIDLELSTKWNKIRDLRLEVTSAMEDKRKAGAIRSSLEAKITLNLNKENFNLMENLNLSEIFICSEVTLTTNSDDDENITEVSIEKAEGEKCERCWKISINVDSESKLCPRCKTVIEFKS